MKVIYITSDCVSNEFNYEVFAALSDGEKLRVAYDNEDMQVFTLDGFQYMFNSDLISDLGYIFIVND